AVIEEELDTWGKRLEHFGVGQGHAGVVAGRSGVAIQPERCAGGQLDTASREGADPQLRPLQVDQHSDRASGFLFKLADDRVALCVVLVRAVTEVQAEDVSPRLEELADGVRARARWSKGGDDFRIS